MSFSFSSLIRLLVLLAMGSTMMAVGLSRLDPPQPGWRVRRPSAHTNINDYFLDVMDRSPRWLDLATGQIAAYPLEDGGVLEASTCSPWVDEKGRRQVVGRWSSRTKAGPMSRSDDFGLGRYTFPEGKLVDQISTEIVPVGPPCWFPGTGARVLFTAGDGRLYHYAFEPENGKTAVGPEPRHDSKPKPLAWRCKTPGDGPAFISEVVWPEDPRMGGCLLASLRQQLLAPNGLRTFTRTQIWWLKLNFAGTEIVECGRLIAPDDDVIGGEYDERSPTASVLPDGRLVLGYLKQVDINSGWELRAAPIDLDPERRVPSASPSATRVLAHHCLPAYPAFSSDGRWIHAVTGVTPSESRIRRFSTGSLSSGI